MLRTKCIKAPMEPTDGLRISIMSRHTMNDGVTPDADIVPKVSYGQWWRSLAPDEKVLGPYLRKDILFETFERRYREKLKNDPEASAAVERLIRLARVITVTVLCVEESPENCHRRILLEVCKRLAPDLEIAIA
ncbi:MAG TPA: DUF488 domain-containing protein [Candidatus Fimivivens sp.]|nr:DUF488 domain-containing protein [Candidatus Fimivivens sp.]